MPAKHWNGFSGFVAELGPVMYGGWVGNVILCIEHFIVGFIFPGLFLMTKSKFFLDIAMYSDIGVNQRPQNKDNRSPGLTFTPNQKLKTPKSDNSF